jgi:hypothetical protein
MIACQDIKPLINYDIYRLSWSKNAQLSATANCVVILGDKLERDELFHCLDDY